MEIKGVCKKGRRVTATAVFMHKDGTVCHDYKVVEVFPQDNERVQQRLLE